MVKYVIFNSYVLDGFIDEDEIFFEFNNGIFIVLDGLFFNFYFDYVLLLGVISFLVVILLVVDVWMVF